MFLETCKLYIYLRLPPKFFSHIFNLSCVLRKVQVRCDYLPSKKLYKLFSQNTTRYASSKSRALMYSSGFQIRAEQLFQSYLLDAIEFPDNALVVDCGANMGDFLLSLECQVNSKLVYIGYEPSPLDYFCLELNSSNSRMKCSVFMKALWKKSETIKFFLDIGSASSSLIEPNFFSDIVSVTAVRLDQEISSPIHLLKVEAEGAEPEVLIGACQLLSKTKFVVVDVGPERGIQQIETRDSVVKFMQDNHFHILKENNGHRKVVLFRNNAC